MRLLVMSVDEKERDVERQNVQKGVFARVISCRDEGRLCRRIREADIEGWDAAVLRLSHKIRAGEVVAVLRSMIPIPLLVIGRADTCYEELLCLQQGADDYQRRDTPEPIVLLRIWRLIELCSSGTQGRGVMKRGGFLDLPEAGQIHYGHRDLELTRREYQVMHWLLQDQSELIPKNHLLFLIWEDGGKKESRALDTVMKQLRRKLSVTPWRIETCYGRGYRLVRAEEPAYSDVIDGLSQ